MTRKRSQVRILLRPPFKVPLATADDSDVRVRSLPEVQIVVGPVDAAIATRWIEHTRRLVAGLREHRDEVRVDVDPALTVAVDSILATWAEVAEGATTFFWRFPVEAEVIIDVVEQWLQLREVPDDELIRLGIDPPADADVRPMTDAVVAAISVALEPLGDRTSDIRLRLRRYR